MARRKDDPRLQAAKGFPGRRRKQTEAEINAAVASAEEPTTNAFGVPAFFLGAPAHWKVAIALWLETAEVLRATGRLRPGYRGALARYCAMSQKWTEAMEQMRRDLPRGGVTVKVVKGDGNEVYRTHPSVDYMSKVGVELRLIEDNFGFTPRANSDLTRVETFNASQGKLPFGGAAPGQGRSGTDDDDTDPAALMTETDSVPPGTRPN